MSVKEVKELFYLATNAKMVVGGDQKEQKAMLRDALAISADLTDNLWPYIPAYRLAHLLFRDARNTADFEEITSLLTHAEKSGSSYVSVHSSMLKFLALHRQKMLGVSGMTEALRECLNNTVSRIQTLQYYEVTTNDWNKPVQGDFFNILEYLIYASGMEYDPVIGAGYDDRNTLFPGRRNDVWCIVGLHGEVDQFCYNYETGLEELSRIVQQAGSEFYFVLGNPRETFLQNASQKKETNYPKVSLLLRLLTNGLEGEAVSEYSKIWANKETAKTARQELDKFLGGMLFQPNARRWAIKPNCKIYGLVNIDRLAEARKPVKSR